jgi:adenylate kinase
MERQQLPQTKSKFKLVCLLGPPGSGRGTQGRRLAEEFGYKHVALGDIFRDEIAKVRGRYPG